MRGADKKYDLVLFDADGTLIDSRARSWQSAARILAALDAPAAINSIADYERHFGRTAVANRFGERHLPTVRAMHRLAMLSQASEITAFEPVVAIAAGLSVRRGIVSASWTETVKRALRTSAAVFDPFLGFDFGTKIEILRPFNNATTLYVGDTADDAAICAALGIDFVAVGWGFDSPESLVRTSAIHVALTATELAAFFAARGLMSSLGAVPR